MGRKVKVIGGDRKIGFSIRIEMLDTCRWPLNLDRKFSAPV